MNSVLVQVLLLSEPHTLIANYYTSLNIWGEEISQENLGLRHDLVTATRTTSRSRKDWKMALLQL